MDFESKYPKLYNFLAAYFPDADFEDLTDEEVVANYRANIKTGDLLRVQTELDTLIFEPHDWEAAADEANRYFVHNHEIGTWLKMIKHELSK